MALFQRLLIANRGEIACRIIQTAKQLDIHTIAVFSEADRSARHARLSDEAYFIGGAAAKDSYLNIDRIIEVAKASGAQAIHPGYGFLAENATFAQRVKDEGLIFVGPSADTIERMGSKAGAKALVIPAGVPVVPGYHGDDQSEARLVEEAKTMGFPLMIKAAAGGGGKGMRIVTEQNEFIPSLHTARREAMSAFGDDRIILERYLSRPRHIEAQILGDQHGRVIHLYERDCSAQRRHQKVIEEAPATGLPPSLRQALLQAAVNAGKAVNYLGAGTVEFLVDPDTETFYFLEMNTRLQVEHPVTEMITGWDLVEWQFRVASGEHLPEQSEVPPPQGHAFEARIYAEDPEHGFLPAIGRIHTLYWPKGVRIDSGVDAHDAIGMDYDPMIAKLIVHGTDRDTALNQLGQALASSCIDGLTTNLGFLQRLAHSEQMQGAEVDTGYLDRQLETLLNPPMAVGDPAGWVAAVAWAHWIEDRARSGPSTDPWQSTLGWRLGLSALGKRVRLKHRALDLDCRLLGDQGHYHLQCEDMLCEIQSTAHCLSAAATHTLYKIEAMIDGQATSALVHVLHTGWIEVSLDHVRTRWMIQNLNESAGMEDALSGQISSPMPGVIVSVHVVEHQHVQAGEVLVVMEAMKMELAIKATTEGWVQAVHIQPGDRIDANTVMIEIDPNPEAN